MGRVKVSKVSVKDRVSACTSNIVNGYDGPGTKYAYATGYLESVLTRVVDMLPPGKREEFLASLESQTKPKPKTRMVRSLMSGELVEIDADTPHCCDPSTETYWSM